MSEQRFDLQAQALLERVRSDQSVVVCVGAGASYAAGMPTWRDLSRQLLERVTPSSGEREEVERFLSGSDTQDVLLYLQNELGHNALADSLRVAATRLQPSQLHSALAWWSSRDHTVVDATPQLLEVLQRDPGRLSDLSPEQFELLVAERLDRMGYAVQRTGSTTWKDGGIDIIAVPKIADVASFLLAVQVKHHRSSRPTGRDAVDRLLAWQNTAFRLGMLVTNTRFTRDAIWTASRDPARNFLRLRDFADLTRWLHGVFNSGLDWREIPDSIELAPGVAVQVPKPQFAEARIAWPLKNAFEPDS